MLQRFINSARINVFESKHFYYWVLLFMLAHLVLRRCVIKLTTIYGLSETIFVDVSTFFVYGLTSLLCLLSILITNAPGSKLFFFTWFSVLLISLINTFRFEILFQDDVFGEMFKGQLYADFRVLFPLLFFTVLHKLRKGFSLNHKIFFFVKKIILINSILVILGVIFNISLFESYSFESGRWGYSGIFSRSYIVVLSSVYLIHSLQTKGKNKYFEILLFTIALVCSGTKAGLLSVILIFMIVVVKGIKNQLIVTSLLGAFLLIFLKWGSLVIRYSNFWKNVYDSHGIWGILTGLRNNTFNAFYELLMNDYTVWDWLFGGLAFSRGVWVEMVFFDLFTFYGIIGFVIFIRFFIKWIPSWTASIPLLVAFVSGQLIINPFAFIIWGIWIEMGKNANRTLNRKGVTLLDTI